MWDGILGGNGAGVVVGEGGGGTVVGVVLGGGTGADVVGTAERMASATCSRTISKMAPMSTALMTAGWAVDGVGSDPGEDVGGVDIVEADAEDRRGFK